MNKLATWIVVIVLVIIGGYYVSTSKEQVSGEPIKIGAILSETGIAAAFGEMSHKGIELAVKEINDAGGVKGKPLEVVFEDDQTDPKSSAGAFQKLTSIDGVKAVIGSNFDFVTQPLFSAAQEKKVVVISPSNPHIPGAFDTNDYSFVMMTEFSDIVRTFENYLKKTEYNQLGIVRFESAFAEEIQNTLNVMQTEMGKKPIVSETYKEIGNNDFKTVILKLKQANVDLVFLDMIAIDPVTFVTQAKQLSYTPKIITHVGIQDALSMKDVDTSIFNGAVSVNWNVSTEDFSKKFLAAYSVHPDKSANRAYDAVYVLAEALSHTNEASEVADILEKMTFSTPNGTFKFNENHAAQNTEVRLEVVKEGKLVEYK